MRVESSALLFHFSPNSAKVAAGVAFRAGATIAGAHVFLVWIRLPFPVDAVGAVSAFYVCVQVACLAELRKLNPAEVGTGLFTLLHFQIILSHTLKIQVKKTKQNPTKNTAKNTIPAMIANTCSGVIFYPPKVSRPYERFRRRDIF